MPSNDKTPTGFCMSSFVRAKHGHAIYSVAWSTDVFDNDGTNGASEECRDENGADDETMVDEHNNALETTEAATKSTTTTPRQVRYMASCGGNHVALYQVEILPDDDKKRKTSTTADPLSLRQAYIDGDVEESFYACAFGGRSLGRPFEYTPVETDENENIVLQEQKDDTKWLKAMADTRTLDGPQLLCVAGTRGVIKVIDTVQQMLAMTLSGHASEIYDLKFSPTDEWLLLSASKDESVRLWNVQSGTCVSIFAGHEGHREAVLTVGWHPQGDRFASGSMDNSVKLWNVGEGTATHKALQASKTLSSQKWDTPVTAPPTAHTFKAAFEQTPYFSSNKIHHDYVDCVEFLGDLVLSKSIHNNIVLWKPTLERPMIRGKPSHQKPPNDVIALAEYTTRECDVWFIRFATDVSGNLLAIGNRKGEVKLFDINEGPIHKKGLMTLTHPQCTSTVRMIQFSPDNKSLAVACEDATVWKFDATYN